MKLKELLDGQNSLNKLLMIKLPVKIAYKISKVIGQVTPELKIYEEQRIKLVKEMGEQTDEVNDTWTVKPENNEKFTSEITALQDIEVNLGFGDGKELEKIKVDELGDLQIESNDLINLGWLFE